METSKFGTIMTEVSLLLSKLPNFRVKLWIRLPKRWTFSSYCEIRGSKAMGHHWIGRHDDSRFQLQHSRQNQNLWSSHRLHSASKSIQAIFNSFYNRSIAVHPTLSYLLTSSDDMLIKLWDWDNVWDDLSLFSESVFRIGNVLKFLKDMRTMWCRHANFSGVHIFAFLGRFQSERY